MTFNIADWVAHVPKDVLAKKFGVDQSVFDSVPTVDPYILNGTASTHNVTSPNGAPTGKSSYAYHTLQHDSEPVPEGGGTFYNIDSRAFPVSTTIAVTFVTLKPKGLRELHWYPTVSSSFKSHLKAELTGKLMKVEEWLNFHSGTGHASVFIGGTNSHTFDFPAGDTAAFPDNSGEFPSKTNRKKTEESWLILIRAFTIHRLLYRKQVGRGGPSLDRTVRG